MASIRRTLPIFLAAALGLAACGKSGAGPTSTDAMSLGDPAAKVTVIEYASASCSHCAAFNNEVFAAFKAKYLDTKKIHYEYHELLTEPKALAAAGFMMARCTGGPERYFQALDALYRAQGEIYRSGDMRGGLLRVAQSMGMTEKQFDDCVSDPKAVAAMNDRDAKAAQDGVRNTPTFMIRGSTNATIEGETTLAKLDDAIAAASR